MPSLKRCKEYLYASSHAAKSFLPSTYTSLYIQEQGHTFVHTMNSLVVHQHHQNIQMRSHNLMLKNILATVVVNALLYNPYVSDIAYLTNIHLIYTPDIAHPPAYEHLCSNLLTEKEGKKKLVPYKKDLMSIMTTVN